MFLLRPQWLRVDKRLSDIAQCMEGAAALGSDFRPRHEKECCDRPLARIVNQAESPGRAPSHLLVRIGQESAHCIAGHGRSIADAPKCVASTPSHLCIKAAEAIDKGLDAFWCTPAQSPMGTLSDFLIWIRQAVYEDRNSRLGLVPPFIAQVADSADDQAPTLDVVSVDLRAQTGDLLRERLLIRYCIILVHVVSSAMSLGRINS
jgi:hypothetical protein